MHAPTLHTTRLSTPSSWVCNSCLARLHARPRRAAAAWTKHAVRLTRRRGSISDEMYGDTASDHPDGPQLVRLDADSSEGLGGTSDDAFGELVSLRSNYTRQHCQNRMHLRIVLPRMLYFQRGVWPATAGCGIGRLHPGRVHCLSQHDDRHGSARPTINPLCMSHPM